MAILDDGIGVNWNGSPTQVQPKTKKLPSWITDYLEKKAAPAPLPNLTAGTRNMAYGYTPNWMQPYLPTQTVKAAPSPRTREGRMGGPTPRPVLDVRAARTGRGGQLVESAGKRAREARTGRGGQVVAPPRWEHLLGGVMANTLAGSAGVPYQIKDSRIPEIERERQANALENPTEWPAWMKELGAVTANTLATYGQEGVPAGVPFQIMPTPNEAGEVDVFKSFPYAWAYSPNEPLTVGEVGAAEEAMIPGTRYYPTTEEQMRETYQNPFIATPEQAPAVPGAEENTIAEEKLGLRKRTELHAIQRAYRKRLEDMINSLDYNQGGEEGYWSAPSGGYWDGYGGGNGGGGYSPEDVSSFWLNLARWNI